MVSGYDAFRSVYIFHGPLRERASPISFQPARTVRDDRVSRLFFFHDLPRNVRQLWISL